MKKAIAVVFLAVLLCAASLSSPSSAATATLTGKMTELQYLVGTWACQTKLPAMGNTAARTMPGTISFEVEPDNTLGYDVSSTEYSGAGFMGYLDAKKLWWSSGADNFGGVSFEVATSGTSAKTVMSGTSTQGGQSVPSRDTMTKASNSKYEDLYETQKDGKWTLGADSTCTKTSNTPG
jgi:hypothetical protein